MAAFGAAGSSQPAHLAADNRTSEQAASTPPALLLDTATRAAAALKAQQLYYRVLQHILETRHPVQAAVLEGRLQRSIVTAHGEALGMLAIPGLPPLVP